MTVSNPAVLRNGLSILFGPGSLPVILSRFPIKQVWDFFALTQIFLKGDVANATPLSFAEKINCLNFYRETNGIRRLLVSSPRSGNRWIQLAFALATDLAEGGQGEYTYEGDIFFPTEGLRSRRLDWRAATDVWDRQHKRTAGPAKGKQLYLEFHNAYFRLRARPIGDMKAVIVTRSIPAILVSQFSKYARSVGKTGDEVERENGFDWDSAIGAAVAFFNSWGDVMRWHPQIRHYKYETLKADPVDSFLEIADFWGLSVPRDCMAEGLHRASKSEMLKRMPDSRRETNLRVNTGSSESRKKLSEERVRYIVDRLNRELISDFGYVYDYDTPYYSAYD